MNKWQRDIYEFHRALDIDVGNFNHPGIHRPELRAELIREESKECIKAIKKGDLIGAIDGMIDTIVVVLGTAVEFGIDLEPFWNEIHKTNMAKQGGETRKDGKKLKPEGWVPPDLKGVMVEYLARTS